ncbi:response regulator [Candidatus Bathyarchaeota archaeon]|nr:response regulator [Candidatus Bathyarchaeota archaeon]
MNESILVVDDDADVRKSLSSILSKEGYSVETVENGKQATRISEKSRFDMALIDIKLPDMEGTELLHRLKENQPHMIKIVITGFPTLENAMKTVNEGADGYILKPFDTEKLLEMIRKHLKRETAEHISNWVEFDQDRGRKSESDRNNAVKRNSLFEPQ